ncbi:hypothetical protein ACH5RR_029090 [Cinchona calisaya]|uniref:Reverse transcriptase RNase H-like domain-containing protein n=1 Tax=Cinchona calisaya TaxID=153742 RepID=A0ABD2YSD6_9GENT
MQNRRPLAFLSQVLCAKNEEMSIYEKELLALIIAIIKWKHYPVRAYFVIETDHESLKCLLDERISTLLQQKWLTKLIGLDYEIQFRKGKENLVANVLSRRVDESKMTDRISIASMQFQ